MRLRIALAIIAVSVGRLAQGQSAAEHIAIGDREHAALNAASALKHYEAALAVDPNNTDALIKAGKPFRLMLYPNKTHRISGPEARTHLFKMMEEFWVKELK
jgi:hypothetical protein